MLEKAQWQLSRYNIRFRREGVSYLWNTLTDALFRLDADGEAYLDAFSGRDDGHPYFSALKAQGCIVDARRNELGLVLTEEKAAMLQPHPRSWHLTIAPGLGCNYRCGYCFEKDRVSRAGMTPETQRELIAYLLRSMDANPNLERLGVTWFGGEPLLYLDRIEAIAGALLAACEERGVVYSSGIVTNGRFLTAETAERLRSLRVGYVQLSLDGTEEVYCRQKGAAAEDYAAVLRNIAAAAPILPITVRINVDEDWEDALRLTELLLKDLALDGKIRVYVAHVRDYGGRCGEAERAAHGSFLRHQGEYLRLFAPGGPYRPESLFFTAPRRRRTTCLSVCGPNYCIGPEGELYRCEHHFGRPEQVVGTIRDGRFFSGPETAYLQFRRGETCEACAMLPVCMGGCMNDAGKDGVALDCAAFQERLMDLRLLSQRREERRERHGTAP